MQVSLNRNIIKLLLLIIILIHLGFTSTAQKVAATNKYRLLIQLIDKEHSLDFNSLRLTNSFFNKEEVLLYINNLPKLLTSKGFPVSSIDKMITKDTITEIELYLGEKYVYTILSFSNIEPAAINNTGINSKRSLSQPLSLFQIESIKERLLNYYENNGYPFANVSLDSIQISGKEINARLLVQKGNYYNIDSIRIFGNAIISNLFLQRYLFISNHSMYNKEKLKSVDANIQELPFLKAIQPSDITMLGTGGVLNLYLQPKKCSQINFLIGAQPSTINVSKVQFTGDVNLDLKNVFGKGESILMKWQQLQPKSPRLNVGFNYPYIFKSSTGLDFMFDVFKKDSNFLQINTKLGLVYSLTANNIGKLFIQLQNNSLLQGAIDTSEIKATKTLPPNVDMKATNIGLNYNWNTTNYRLNPSRGNEINFTTSIGIKNLKINNDIRNIKDPGFNYALLYDSLKLKSYQIRMNVYYTHFFSIKKNNVIKLGFHGGGYFSPEVFRNDLFQIGGYKLLRGFDEESIYATKYGVISLEYRFLLALNSYFSFFTDYGAVQHKFYSQNVNNNYVGTGISLLYETKNGVLNISYGLGKRDDMKLSIRENSKIHFGYINYF